MERAAENINIPRDARLSIELKLGKGSPDTNSAQRAAQGVTSRQSTLQNMSALPAAQKLDIPMRPKDLPTVHTSQGESFASQTATVSCQEE